MASDGKVVIGTEIDEKGAKTGLKRLGHTLGRGSAVALKGTVAAIGAVGAAVGAITVAAVKSYAEYEQLVGGVETLFKGSSDTVQKYAANAYKTAGLSANKYMETVTGFSASLLQSLDGDTEKAAKAADSAVTDMADNANKMGSSTNSIQLAYQGFAKQNYGMLDNLKLGYGGTKAEMQRLLADAEKMSGKKYDMGNLDDVYSAIHVVQTEIGITGTTALEASETISGSVAMTKASWSNLITGIADDNADFSGLMENFVESAGTAAENILPRIKIALEGVGELINELVPVIIEALPELIETILPVVIDSVLSLFNSIAEILPDLINIVVDLAKALVQGMIDNADVIGESLAEGVISLVEGILELLPMILDLGLKLIIALAKGIVEGLPELIPAAAEAIDKLVDSILDNLDELIVVALDLIIALADGLIKAMPTLVTVGPKIIGGLVKAFIKLLPKLIPVAIDIIVTIATALIAYIPLLLLQLPKVIAAIVGAFKETDWTKIGKDIINGLVKGIKGGVKKIKDAAKGIAKHVKDSFKNLLGIKSPSTVFKGFGKNIDEGLIIGLASGLSKIKKATKDLAKGVKVSFNAESPLDDINASFAYGRGAVNTNAQLRMSSVAGMQARQQQGMTLVINNPEPSPDAIYRTFSNNMEYGLARSVV